MAVFLLFGVYDGAVRRGVTWEWHPAAVGLRMAARLQPALGAFDCLGASCPLREVSVRARAGGVGDAIRARLFEGEAGVDLDRTWATGDLEAFVGATGGVFTLVVEDHRGEGEQGALRSWCVRVNDRPEACTRLDRTIPLGFPLRSPIEVDGERVDSLEVEVHLDHPDTAALTLDLHHLGDAPGAELELWTGFGWETVARNDALPEDASEEDAELTYTWPNDDEADPLAGLDFGRLVFGRTLEEKAINVRLKPKHPGGKRRDLGDIAADYLEVRVEYTHPAAEAPPEPDP